jgi:beta-mannosidase
METISLDGKWQMRKEGDEWLGAEVPGSVYADLLRAKKMPDPYWGDNESDAGRLMEFDYRYRRSFSVPAEFLSADALLLRFEGLDTVADIYLNGKPAGSADNMHRTWEFGVKALVHAGDNEIEVLFHSPLAFIRRAYAENPADGSSECTVGFPTLRKAHCQFGWDWGPRLPDAGIWRSVCLVAVRTARIRSVLVTQRHEAGKVTLGFRPETEILVPGADVRLAYSVVSPGGRRFTPGEDGSVVIDSPELWWPHGYGDQPLYTVTAALEQNGVTLDIWQRRIGLRTMEMHIEKDDWGESFAHRVNGVDIFAMGADYIPEDSVFGLRSEKRTRRLLEDCVLANFNTVRVWGGGCYPDDWFYDICDELGLIVWQDMMFACAVYNLTPEFEENIASELGDNIRRIRHHACIGLFCGNNEMEMFVDLGTWVRTKRQKADYIKMYEYLFPKLIGALAPQVFYWPASPSSGGSFDEPNSPDRGDVHYWEVWHGGKPFSEYRRHYFRYLSEFGFESLPCEKTVGSFAPAGEQNLFSYIMEKHQKCPGANGKIITYLAQNYLYPRDFGTLVYASQLLQAEAIRSGTEHLRRNRGRCMGAIYWQMNDCWPVISWSSIDYFGRWKALHYYAKRFFAPVLLSADIESALLSDPDVNRQDIPAQKSAALTVVNERRTPFRGRVEWMFCSPGGEPLSRGETPVSVPALGTACAARLDAADYPVFSTYIFYSLFGAGGELISQGSSLFCAPKHFRYADPKLTARASGGTVTVTAKAYAGAVRIESDDPELLLEDNYFDMQPGERQVKVLRGGTEGIRLKSIFDIR